MQTFLRDFLDHAARGTIPTILLEFSDADPEKDDDDNWRSQGTNASHQRTLSISKNVKNSTAYAKFLKVRGAGAETGRNREVQRNSQL